MKRLAIALVIVVAGGAALLPLQRNLEAGRQSAGFESPRLDLSLREKVSQMGFLAALSGFRSFVAAVLWIEAHTAWEKTDWTRMISLLETVTTLQPHSVPYWDTAAWHMGWNASQAALEDKSQPSEALRRRAQRKYFETSEQFLKDGIENNPGSYLLWESMGRLLRDKFENHCEAAEAFARAAGLPGARPYLRRMAAYELAQCPGQEEKAYRELKTLYDLGKAERKLSLIARLKELEEKLGIPASERIKESIDQ